MQRGIPQWGALQAPREEVAMQIPLHGTSMTSKKSSQTHGGSLQRFLRNTKVLQISAPRATPCGYRRAGIQPRNGCNSDTASMERM
jgi:hypothetical protein